MTRRDLVGVLIGGASSANALTAEQAPMHEWAESHLLGLSPDGKFLSLAKGAPYTLSARLTTSGWKAMWDTRPSAVSLEFIRLEDLSAIYKLEMNTIPTKATFSPDSTIVWMYGAATKTSRPQQYVVDLHHSLYRERPDGEDSPFFDVLVAADRGIMAVPEGRQRPAKEARWDMRRLDGSILFSASYIPEGAANRYRSAAGHTYSADRQVLAQPIGDDVALRNCKDFGIQWMKNVGSRAWAISSVSLSADGRRLGVLLIEPNFNLKDRKAKAVVLDTENGQELTVFPVRSFDLVSMSADGAMAAVGVQVRTRAAFEEYDLEVDLHAVDSGRVVRRLQNDRVAHSQNPMATYVDRKMIQFTSDGKYVLTTGRKTKLWRMANG